MSFRLIWLPTALRAAGLPVVEVPGWENRGHGDISFNVQGVLCHHTAGPLTGDAPSLPIVVNGRPDLAGPLSQLFLARSGTWHVVAAGKAWHAGKGDAGTVWENFDGNGRLIGVEAENTGLPNDPWPHVQMESYAKGVAAVLKHLRSTSAWALGHKEYAPSRKTDPSFSMSAFRAMVDSHLGSPIS